MHIFLLVLFVNKAKAVTLSAGQENYSTTENITNSGSGIISSLDGSDISRNTIQNLHIITTGNSGATSSAYGIKAIGDYNDVSNAADASILTTGSSGRAMSVTGDNSSVTNLGSINTEGTTSHGMYIGGDGGVATNSGSIVTLSSGARGMYANGNNFTVNNSGSITTSGGYGIGTDGDIQQVTNSGTITTNLGSSAYGIYVSTGAGAAANETDHAVITNSSSGVISSNSHGIYARDNYVEINNDGTINSADSSSVYGINSSGDNITINNSGTITSNNYAIYNNGSDVVINNSGNLDGGVRIGSGVLNILGGSISGNVDGDSGVGNIVIGSDVYSAITFNQAADFLDIGNLSITSNSVLNANNSIAANAIFISDNSTLNINEGASISGTLKGDADSVGVLNINDGATFSNGIVGISGAALNNFNINSGANFSTQNDVYATEISLGGIFDLSTINGLTIFGNVSGSGSGSINVGSNIQTIDGDFILSAGDSLSVSLGLSGAGKLIVTGQANIDSDAGLKIISDSDQGYIENGTQFTILSAGAGSTISAINDENINVNSSGLNGSGLLEFTTKVQSNNLILDVSRLEASKVTSNKNAQNIYKNINLIGASSSDELREFQIELDTLEAGSSEITEALNQLTPQSTKANLAITNSVANNSAQISIKRLRLSSDSLSNRFWAQIFGQSSAQDEIKEDDGYNVNSIGMIFGAEKDVFDIADIGTSLSYARSGVKSSNSLQNNLIDSVQINFYGGVNFDDYFVDVLAGFSWNLFSSKRAIETIESSSTARYSGQTYITKLATGFAKKLNYDLVITPAILATFTKNNVSGYSEEGSNSLDLDVKSISANYLEIRMGTSLNWSIEIPELKDFSKLTISSNVSYGHYLISDTPNTVSNFRDHDSSFNTEISDFDDQSLKFELGVTSYNEGNSTLSLNYNLEHRATYQSHGISLKARQEF